MDVRLYINNMKVDLNDDNLILFNWQEMDTSNPTIIKNGYSKTIVLQGTDNNNEIFGHFWNLERYQAGGSFNPSYRVPFVLYYNSAVYERGYVKLQKVIKENKTVKYEIGLFGGLGSFIYNLSTNWNTGEKKNLSDLNFFGLKKPKIYSINAITGSTTDNTGSTVIPDDIDFSFTINADTVKTAWENIESHPKWSMINFAPTYVGLPDNLDSDKVLINFNNLTSLTAQTSDDSGNYRTYGGYALGKLPDKLTSEEVKDYRSYIQTPVLRVKSIFDAICMKENNKGKFDNGYEVILDDDFFNDKNPYFYDSWITLPQLSLNSVYADGETEDWGDAKPISIYTGDKSITYVFRVDNNTSGSKVKIKTKLRMNIDSSQFGKFNNPLYLSATAPFTSIGTRYDVGAIAIQAYASNSFNSIENAVDGSKINWLTNSFLDYSDGTIDRYSYDDAVRGGFYTNWLTNEVTDLEGDFNKKSANVYEWFGTNDGYIEMETDVPANTPYLKICIQLVPVRSNGILYIKNSQSLNSPAYKNVALRPTYFSLIDKDIVATKFDNQNTYSNRVISKDILLNTTYSPAEFLISYCKTFGLHLFKDIVEDKIYICPRNKFYDRENIIDINDKIDHSKPIEINPVYVDTNYVSLSNEVVDGISNKDYKGKYGKIFGQKIIDTGFEFNADTNELNSSSVLKNAIQTKEQSQYFYLPDSNGINPYVYNGFTYSLYKDGQSDGETKTIEVPKKVLKDIFNFFEPEYPFYDILSKPQFEDDTHKRLDTEGVMLFFTGKQDVTDKGLYLTDDNSYMSILNNNPCWLMTNSEYDTLGAKIASKITELPRFSRYYEGNKYMIYSWDYGSPRELYVPDIQNNEEGNIYHLYFKNYLTDLYDINTKVVTCYVKADDILTEEYLRKIYWFDNAIWRLNRIYDYNPTSPNTTKCEFIKIQNLSSFDVKEATTNPWVNIYLDMYYIGQTGGTITGTVKTWNNSGWSIESIEYDPSNPLSRGVVTVTPETYWQSGNFLLSVPSNIRDNREVTINIKTDDGGSGSVTFRQPGVKYSFGISPTEFNVEGDYSSEATLNITNPYYYDWSVKSTPEWISIVPSGVTNGQTGTTGNTVCAITVAKNTSEERTGIVVIEETTYGKSYSITVKQKAAASKVLTGLTIDNFEWTSNFPADAGTYLTKDYSTFNVIGHYNDGTTEDLTTVVDITGEVTLQENTSAKPRIVEAPLMAHYIGIYESVTKRGFQNGAASPSEKPLTFNIISGGTIVWATSDSSVTKTIEYKLNGGNWVSIISNTGASAPTIAVNTGDKIQFRGSNTSYGEYASSYSTFGNSTAEFKVEGNIMSLIDKNNFATATTLESNYTFNGLFNGCTRLTSAENLILPATTLADGCYYNMFAGCSSLTTAPKELPSDTLTTNCYAQMFWNCTSLTKVPKLPATTLATYCYSSMFAGCKSLTTVPELPATTLATNCYYNMFKNCTSIITAPALPANTLANSCYRDMFYNCTSLTTAPELPATTLTYQCYNSMFQGCKSLTQAPVLPANSLVRDCYKYMFAGCTSLTTAPELPATTLAQDCYNSMFDSCTSLTTAPELPATILDSGCYSYMFYGCTKLKYIKCLATDISATNCTKNWVDGVAATGTFVKSLNMSGWTTGISGIPEGWTVLNYVPSLLTPKITSIDADIKNN